MSELFGALKVLIATVVLLMLMQIHVGNESIENHIMTWVHTSSTGSFLKDSASGGVRVVSEATEAVSNWISENTSLGHKNEKESKPRRSLSKDR